MPSSRRRDHLEPPRTVSPRVMITDTGSEYRVEVIASFLCGKTEPLTVTDTAGLRRRIMSWLTHEAEMHGTRLDVVYVSAHPKRDPECPSCRGNTILVGARRPGGSCNRCSGGAALFLGFTD